MSGVERSPLTELRRTRRLRRLGDTEWFDVAYQVYLGAILGGGGVIFLSGYVGDVPLGDADVARVLQHAPAILGVLVAVAVAVGLRSGAEGGPLSIESADARHLLLAPVPRRSVLRQPFLQRARTMAGAGAMLGAMAGVLAAQRLPGTGPAWVESGAAFGACIGLAVVVIAVHAHAAGLPSWAATVLGGAVCGWQVWAAVGDHTGPFDTLGDLALWGDRQHPIDLVEVGAIVVLGVLALFTVGRLRVEHLDRRGDLVSQLRFAVTTQDLRTVVLLRRQLRNEHARRRPLIDVSVPGSGPGVAVVRRSTRSLLRMPPARLGRVVALGAGAGVAAGMAVRGTTPGVLVCGLLLFVMGLDLIEPLSQEIDHPERTDDLPVDDGWLQLRLLAAPAVAAVIPAMAGALACTVVAPSSAPAAFAMAVPITWAGMAGSVVNAVRDGFGMGDGEAMMMPPEFTGMKNVMVMLFPLVVSTIGPATILAVRARPDVATAVQMVVVLLLLLVAFGYWVLRRNDLRRKWTEIQQGATR